MRQLHKHNLYAFATWLNKEFIDCQDLLAYNKDYKALNLNRDSVKKYRAETMGGIIHPLDIFNATQGNDGRRHPLTLAPLCPTLKPIGIDYADEYYLKDVGRSRYTEGDLVMDRFLFRIFGINAGADVFWAIMFSPQSATFDVSNGIPTAYNIFHFLHCVGYSDSTVPRQTGLEHHKL